MTVLYSNNAASTLAATITNSTTSMSVASGHGIKFPAPSGGDYFFMTLVDTGGTIEIVKVTARTNDTMTIERGQDGTTASAFSAGSKVELRITKAMLDQLKLDAGLLGFTNVFYDQLNNSAAVGGEVALGSGATISANGAIAIGPKASASAGAEYSLVVGNQAASIAPFATALGFGARVEAETGIAIGFNSLVNSGANNAIAIGYNTGVASNATNSIVLGATSLAIQPNAVVLNASDGAIYSLSAGFFVKPIRDSSNNQTVTGVLKYDNSTGEIFYSPGSDLIGSSANFHTVVGGASFVAPEVIGNCIAMGIATSVEGATEGGLAVGWLASVVGSSYGTAIGMQAKVYQGAESGIAIGMGAETSLPKGIAIGNYAIANTIGGTATGSIAIGENANASDGGVAIGANTGAAGNVVVLNGTGSNYGASTEGFYVKPIRDNTYFQTSSGVLQYDSATGEIFYGGGGLIGSTPLEGNSAFGYMATASGTEGTAIGWAALASGASATALGSGASATGDYGVAVGHASKATGLRSIAIGWAEVNGANSIYISSEDFIATLPINAENSISIQGRATGDYGIAMGMSAMAPGYSVAIGGSSNGGSGTYTVVIGQGATVEGDGAIAIGASILSSGTNSVAIGRNVNSISDGGIAIGYAAQVSGPSGVAIGNNASASEGIAIGTVVAEATGLFVKPVRNNTYSQTSAGFLQYDSTTGEVFYGPAYAYYNSNTTNALDYTNGSVQRWAPSTGAQTLSITNWPPSGNLGELMIEGVNLGAATITWPAAIKWVKSDGSTTTTFSSSGVTLQTSGTDFVVLWTRDAGTTIYGKVVR